MPAAGVTACHAATLGVVSPVPRSGPTAYARASSAMSAGSRPSSSGASPSRRGMPGSGQANCERPAGDILRHAFTRACRATPQAKSALRRSHIVLAQAHGSRLLHAAVGRFRAHDLQLSCGAYVAASPLRSAARDDTRHQSGDVPDSLNCSRVMGKYQHASANGHCATSPTCTSSVGELHASVRGQRLRPSAHLLAAHVGDKRRVL